MITQYKLTIPEPANSTEDSTPNPSSSSSDRGECGICGERVAKLAKHMRKFHEDDVAAQKKHNCRECDTNFNSDEDLDAHRLIYHN